MADDEYEFEWQRQHASLNAMADDIGLEDEERESFVSSAMKRKGFRQVTSWADPEPKDKSKESGDFFSSRRENREKRQVSGGGRSRSQYDN